MLVVIRKNAPILVILGILDLFFGILQNFNELIRTLVGGNNGTGGDFSLNLDDLERISFIAYCFFSIICEGCKWLGYDSVDCITITIYLFKNFYCNQLQVINQVYKALPKPSFHHFTVG